MITLPQTPAVHPTSAEMAELDAFLCELAYKAGDVIRPYFRSSIVIQNKAENSGQPNQHYDPVSVADQQAEEVMRALIKERYPEHGIYGEEFGFEAGKSGLTWVLDPIDGTRSFITGMLHWGVLIALFNGEEPILGGLYQPVLDELFIGNGDESRLQQQDAGMTLRTRQCDTLAEAIVCCTHPDLFAEQAERAAFAELLSQAQLSRYGGDCYHYGLLAMGFVDVCVESSLKAYDIQALVPLVEGAGGVVTTWAGKNPAYGGQIIAAANAEIHAQALRILAPAAKT